MATLVVLGSGIMATALATPFTDNANQVRLVGTHLDREIIESIKTTGVHPNLNLKVPDGVTAYQLEDAAEAFEGVDLVMSGVNSFGVDWAGEQLAGLLRSELGALRQDEAARGDAAVQRLGELLSNQKEARQVAARLAESLTLARAFHSILYTSPSPRDRTRSRMPSSACKKKTKISIK